MSSNQIGSGDENQRGTKGGRIKSGSSDISSGITSQRKLTVKTTLGCLSAPQVGEGVRERRRKEKSGLTSIT